MSGLIVGLVIRTPISEVFNTEAKFIATIYADHAWEDGTHAYPAVDTVAKFTGLHERTIQRYLVVLKSMGMLIPDGKGPRGTNKYKFPLEEKADGSVRLALSGGGTQSPRQADGGDTVSGDTVLGDTGVTQTNNPSSVLVVVNAEFGKISSQYEQEFGALTPMIADAIKDSCDTYPPDWIPEAMQIAVQSNKRSWKYVEGILKNCKAKNIRPSLNKLEANYANRKPSGSPKQEASQRAIEQDAGKLAEIKRRQQAKRAAPIVP